jgi:hypothetical protein
MGFSLLLAGVLLFALVIGPFGVYTFALNRLQRPVPAFLAGSALIVLVMLGTALSLADR